MADPTPPERPKSRSLKPLRALLPYLAPYRGVLLAALGALLVAAAAMLALPVALRYLIDEGMAAGSPDTINRYFIAFLAAAAVFGVFAALRFHLVSWLGERVVADLRSAVYDRVIRMDPSFFEVTRTGEVLSPADQLETFSGYVDDPVPETQLLITTTAIDKRRNFFQKFAQKGEVVEFRKLYEN